MEFCPSCGMLLQFEPTHDGLKSRFHCPTCPYIYYIDRKIVRNQKLVKKQVEPIFSADAGMEQNDKDTNVVCPNCRGKEAYYKTIQIRSADEPMSIFYMCANKSCKARWRED